MDEASGCCGLIAIILVIVLGVVVWREVRREPAPPVQPAPAGAPADAPAPPDDDQAERRDLFAWWPFGIRAAVILLGLLYCLGLLLIRPVAMRAKREGASNQQAALAALTFFAFSPIVVPIKGLWDTLGALGLVLTRDPGEKRDPGSKPPRPKGLNDLD